MSLKKSSLKSTNHMRLPSSSPRGRRSSGAGEGSKEEEAGEGTAEEEVGEGTEVGEAFKEDVEWT